jgi:hypothetical protein
LNLNILLFEKVAFGGAFHCCQDAALGKSFQFIDLFSVAFLKWWNWILALSRALLACEVILKEC